MAHPGTKRTYSLISLIYWWPKMRESIEAYIRKCDSCQRRKSHLNNKRLYDRKAKPREFKVQDLVYLYNPAIKPGLSKKFAKPWSGPWQITKKISELNYEIIDQKGKRQVGHVNRLKKSFNWELWKRNWSKDSKKNAPKKVTRPRHEKGDPQADFKIGPYLLVYPQNPEARNEREPQVDHSPATPNIPQLPLETPVLDRIDADYCPSDSPISRCQLQTSRTQPPLTRLHAKAQSHDNGNPCYLVITVRDL
jgi:hypothetical protein